MPIYEYVCKACDHEFEREQRISEPPVKTCPACGARQARRLISRTSFVLKGGGWYSDLYGSPGGANAKSDASAKPDSKPAETAKDAPKSDGDGGDPGGKKKSPKKKGGEPSPKSEKSASPAAA